MPTLSGSLNLTGSLNITGSLTLNGNQIISGSINTTGTITSNGSPVITNVFSGSYATTGSNTFTGNQNIVGAVTSSGDFVFTTIGSSIIYPINDFIPNGTASFSSGSITDIQGSNTTASLSYGINLISTASNTQYCCTLPTIPKKGKSVTIINKSGVDVRVFPSQIGGDINGTIDGNFTIPSDNESYIFNCYENPLPGGWSVVSSGGGQATYTTGEISIPITSSLPFVTAAVNNNIQQSTQGSVGVLSSFGTLSDVANAYIVGLDQNNLTPIFIPDTPWTKINGVQVISNLSGSYGSSLVGGFISTAVIHNACNITYNVNNGEYNQFMFNSAYNNFVNSTYNTWLNTNIGDSNVLNGAAQIHISPFVNQYTPQFYTTPGTFVPSATSPIVSDTVGGPGTWRSKKLYPTNTAWGKKIGKNFIGAYYDSQVSSNIEFYDGRSIGFKISINPYAYSGTPFVLKLKFLINVTI